MTSTATTCLAAMWIRWTVEARAYLNGIGFRPAALGVQANAALWTEKRPPKLTFLKSPRSGNRAFGASAPALSAWATREYGSE